MWRRLLKLIGRPSVANAAEAPAASAGELLAAGIARHQAGDIAGAETIYRRMVAVEPTHAGGVHSLGVLLGQRGEYREAEGLLRIATLLEKDNPIFLFNLGNVFKAQGKLDEAIEAYRRAIEIAPSLEAHFGLGNALQAQQRFGECADSYERAIALRPDYAEAHYNLGCAFQALGRRDAAIVCYRRALLLAPDHSAAHTNLIFVLDMSPAECTVSLQAERRKWDDSHATHWPGPHVFGNHMDPERRLRIGYVSADIREHSAVYVFGAMLTEFDRAYFDVFVYSNSRVEDEITRQFHQSVTGWRNIATQTDDAVAAMVRDDQIDILVDLSGHSGGNRLLVFARKPAPIQITAWGYATSTGLRAIDVFFGDPVVVPPEDKHLFTEEVRYLPNIVGSHFPRQFPNVLPLPAISTKSLTFGSFNRLVKLTDQVFTVWGQVLNAVPDSKMVLKVGELDDQSARNWVIEHFRRVGIDPERITLLGGSSWQAHMEAFNRIDIALDPFPHGGGVTTLEGLMMGVPVITLRWPTIVGRLSASILTTLGLTDWIAETAEQYVEIARREAGNLEALAALRLNLREIFYASPIGDTAGYVKAVEREYRQLWREWCERQGPDASRRDGFRPATKMPAP